MDFNVVRFCLFYRMNETNQSNTRPIRMIKMIVEGYMCAAVVTLILTKEKGPKWCYTSTGSMWPWTVCHYFAIFVNS